MLLLCNKNWKAWLASQNPRQIHFTGFFKGKFENIDQESKQSQKLSELIYKGSTPALQPKKLGYGRLRPRNKLDLTHYFQYYTRMVALQFHY